MAAVVAADAADALLKICADRGLPAWILGEIVPGSGKAVFG
jgi:phosphoribosylformylglycinamidine cyclo-ligase